METSTTNSANIRIPRIKSTKTLSRLITTGAFQRELESGKIFNPACGKFTDEICTCNHCLDNRGQSLRSMLIGLGMVENIAFIHTDLLS